MATKTQKKKVVKSDSKINEVVAIILLAISVLVFLSLISYNPNDEFFRSNPGQPKTNWIGVVGANIAGILINYLVGWTAFIFPPILALIAWRVFRTDNLFPRFSRILGYLLLIVSLSGLFELFGSEGAMIGNLFADKIFIYLLGKIGAGILLGALFL
ncbi:MAG TPA: DNA translocase FtsK 4TM domain-containing protein, partial [Pyrinomonadaceae bacterium]